MVLDPLLVAVSQFPEQLVVVEPMETTMGAALVVEMVGETWSWLPAWTDRLMGFSLELRVELPPPEPEFQVMVMVTGLAPLASVAVTVTVAVCAP